MENSSTSRPSPLLSTLAGLVGLGALLLGGCYHVAFDQGPPQTAAAVAAGGCADCGGATAGETRHKLRRSTWMFGAIGSGRVDTTQYCSHPTRTETKASARDMAAAALTLGIYTPRTLYVTCPSLGSGGA